MEIPEEIKGDLIKLQQFQQQIQVLMIQKQNIQIQISEIENALKEIKEDAKEELYEIVGTVMIKRKPDELKVRLSEKKEVLELRLSTIDRQVNKINKSAKEIQEKLAKQIRK